MIITHNYVFSFMQKSVFSKNSLQNGLCRQTLVEDVCEGDVKDSSLNITVIILVFLTNRLKTFPELRAKECIN